MGISALRASDAPVVGRYRLVGRLGTGGMGVVYLATTPTGEPVAVKLLRDELAGDPEFRVRFRQEVRALVAVRGVCAAAVLDFDTENDPPYLVTEFVPGPTLAEYVVAHGPMSGARAHGFAVGLAEALRAIHDAGLVHRDLKPANVLLGPHGPKVIDFGVARLADAATFTRTGLVVGTPGYLAPEQYRGEAGAPADVFAWGLTVAFAVTGRTPFREGPAGALPFRLLNDKPDLAAVPAALRGIVAATLAKRPGDRPTAAELLDGLIGPAPGPRDTTAVTTVLRRTWEAPAPGHLVTVPPPPAPAPVPVPLSWWTPVPATPPPFGATPAPAPAPGALPVLFRPLPVTAVAPVAAVVATPARGGVRPGLVAAWVALAAAVALLAVAVASAVQR